MNCKICDSESLPIFKALVLRKYTVQYYQCNNCQFIQTEKPYWLDEAYARPINVADTGILERNIELRDLVTPILYLFFKKNSTFVDYAGGYGVFTRLMRDVGFNYLWSDPFAKNLFAEGFKYTTSSSSVEAMTAFEVFEHLENPSEELEKILSQTKTLLFTTQIIPQPTPLPNNWWYFGFEHGQHVSFYTKKSFEILATKYQMKYYTNGINFHILTPVFIPNWKLSLIFRYFNRGLFGFIKKRMVSKTISDMNQLL